MRAEAALPRSVSLARGPESSRPGAGKFARSLRFPGNQSGRQSYFLPVRESVYRSRVKRESGRKRGGEESRRRTAEEARERARSESTSVIIQPYGRASRVIKNNTHPRQPPARAEGLGAGRGRRGDTGATGKKREARRSERERRAFGCQGNRPGKIPQRTTAAAIKARRGPPGTFSLGLPRRARSGPRIDISSAAFFRRSLAPACMRALIFT